MTLKNIQSDIQKCSKCGLCMSVCPLYKATNNDCSVSRGLFIMLNGVLAGRLKLNKKINKYLDLCLKCNACKEFCPTGIDARNIIQKSKEEYYMAHKNSFMNFCAPILFNIIMHSIEFFSFCYRLFYIDKIMKMFYPFLLKFELGKELILLNTVLERGFKKQSSLKNPTKIKVVYFKGCVNEYINPKIKKASEYLLNRMGVEIIPIDFTCCGISYLNDGNVDLFLKFAYKNLSNIPDDFDYFLTDCVTCKYAFEMYEKYITDEKLKQKIQVINKKSLSVSEFVIKNMEKINFKKNISFTFHKPCHMQNDELIKDFIKKCTQANYEQMPDSCCGFSGAFAIKHRNISKKISKQSPLMNANNVIITTCPACLMGLNQGLIANNHTEHFSKHFIEFLAENIV